MEVYFEQFWVEGFWERYEKFIRLDSVRDFWMWKIVLYNFEKKLMISENNMMILFRFYEFW